MDAPLSNEFALVRLEIDDSANGKRLKITSNRTGHSRSLDPLLLEALTWMPIKHLIGALETPFGPEPELGVVRTTNEYEHEPEGIDGNPKAE